MSRTNSAAGTTTSASGPSSASPSPQIRLSPHIVKNADFLIQLARSARARRRRVALIRGATPDQLLCIVEICLNLLRARLPLSGHQCRQLKSSAYSIRRLSRVRSANAARRLLLRKQIGGFFAVPTLAAVLANLVVPLIGEVIQRL